MSVTLTKEFWTNFVLFVVACVALGLSIWGIATPCKKDSFSENYRENSIFNNKESCEKFTRNNFLANRYCRGWSGKCNTTDNCPDHPFSEGEQYPCLCPGSNSKNCKQKVCKIKSSLPYCIETKGGKWEVECN